jgi:hypothetical protein
VLLAAGDAVEFVSVGEDYISWAGGRCADSGTVRIGLSLNAVGAAVKPGGRLFGWRLDRLPRALDNGSGIASSQLATHTTPPRCPPPPSTSGLVILVDDGNLAVRVTRVVDASSCMGEALNSHTLREMSLVHVPHAYRWGLRSRRDAEATQRQVPCMKAVAPTDLNGCCATRVAVIMRLQARARAAVTA